MLFLHSVISYILPGGLLFNETYLDTAWFPLPLHYGVAQKYICILGVEDIIDWNIMIFMRFGNTARQDAAVLKDVTLCLRDPYLCHTGLLLPLALKWRKKGFRFFLTTCKCLASWLQSLTSRSMPLSTTWRMMA